MPFKVFSNGVPLPASDLNDYLMEQSIATFADSAARTAALVSPTEGQVTYLADSDTFAYYDGSNWVGFGGGQTLISSTTLTGASVTFSSIPQNFKDLRIVVVNFKPSADARLWARVNGISTNNYQEGDSIPTGVGQWVLSNTQDSVAASSFYCLFEIYSYKESTNWKIGRKASTNNNATTATTADFDGKNLNARITDAIDSVTLLPSTGTFTSGTAYLYGVN